MAETILIGCDGQTKWHWYSIKDDLVATHHVYSDLLNVNPFKTTAHGCGGMYDGAGWHITWVKDKFLLLTMSRLIPELVRAFAAVVEYEPFIRYTLNDNVTTEWDKTDPEKRLEAIKELEGVKDIEMVA